MQFLPSSHLISLSEDGDLIVWDTHSWRPIRTLALGEKGKSFTYFSVHPSEKLLFAISPSDSILALCDLRTARCAYSMKLKDRPVEIECSPCGDMYALVHSNTLSLYGMHSMDAVCSLHLRDNVEINCVMFLSKNMLAFGGEIDFIKIVTIDKFVTNESEFEAHENRVKSLKGTLPFLFSSSTDGKVKVWYLKDATRIDLQLIGEINLGVRLTSLTVSCISEFISNDTDRDELQAISYEDKFKKMALYYKRKNYKTRNVSGVNFRLTPQRKYLGLFRIRGRYYKMLRKIKVQNF